MIDRLGYVCCVLDYESAISELWSGCVQGMPSFFFFFFDEYTKIYRLFNQDFK